VTLLLTACSISTPAETSQPTLTTPESMSTTDPTEALRAEQAARDVVIPNTRQFTAEMREYIAYEVNSLREYEMLAGESFSQAG
jgi:hypothetical protein